jgi:hypothetical protein
MADMSCLLAFSQEDANRLEHWLLVELLALGFRGLNSDQHQPPGATNIPMRECPMRHWTWKRGSEDHPMAGKACWAIYWYGLVEGAQCSSRVVIAL